MKQIQNLLSQEMTRKEFLQLLGMAVLTFVGVGNFIALWRKNAEQNASHSHQASSSFGSRKFGI